VAVIQRYMYVEFIGMWVCIPCQEVDVSCSNIVVHLICPVCRRRVPNHDISAHLAGCLQEVGGCQV